ncbi:MAG: YHYH protein [Akkermansiaceae bacterium]|nr:YHYH protein [Akkermansiaceae bacterium]
MKHDKKNPYQITQRGCAHAAGIFTLLILLGEPSKAHEKGPGAHDHEAVDARLTPRDADSHVTGQLPRSRGENTDAKSTIRLVIRDKHRYVTANGVPDHKTGQFPNRGNPNVVSEQSYTFRIPLDPAPPAEPVLTADQVHRDNGYLFGVALNGVPFEPATGMNWTPEGIRRGGRPGDWVHEAIGGSIDFGIDHANAHVQRTGAYHYHGIPTPLISDKKPTLLGYAADGYPIYGPLGHQDPEDANSPLIVLKSSWQLKTEERPAPPQGPGGMPDGRYTSDFEFKAGSGDLDRLNGRFAVTPEYPEGVYHYVLTADFPHIPRGFAGQADPSFRRMPGEGPNHVRQRGDRLRVGDRNQGSPR